MPQKDIVDLIQEEEAQMRGEGWKKELTIKHIEVHGGVIYCEEWDFFADTMPCQQKAGGVSGPACGAKHTWVTYRNGKLFWACAVHKACTGPISFSDVGVKAKEYTVDPDKAVEICRVYGQTIPKGVRDLFQASKTVMTKQRRPNE